MEKTKLLLLLLWFLYNNGYAQTQPNIVFILADDLGYGDIGSFGSIGKGGYYETPNITRLAEQGVIFTSAYTNGPNCAPTRAALLSGQYYPRQPVYTVGTGARGNRKYRKLEPVPNGKGLPLEIYTMAEALRDAGYVTGHFGKWHTGPFEPSEQGFEESLVHIEAGGFRLEQGTKLSPEGHYIADELTKKAVDFIERHRDGPFFLFLSHYVVHSPFQAPEALVRKYLKKRPVAGHYHAKYAAMMETLDNSVGNIMVKLEESGISQNTLVVFYSDNGGLGGYIDQGIDGVPRINPLDEGQGGTVEITHNVPLRGGKGQLYEGGIRVPLIIRWPEVIYPGTEISEPVISIDFYKTFAELSGASVPDRHELDGESLLPLFRNPKSKLRRDALFWHFPGYLQTRKPGSWRTTPVGVIRWKHWKLLQFFEDNHLELYNLDDDIGEHYDLSEKYPEQVGFLFEMLEKWRADMKAPMPVCRD